MNNTQSIQTAQLTPTVAGAPLVRPPTPPPPPPPQRILTPAARMANAKLITVNKTTTAGATLLLAAPQALARDCSPLGRVDVKVVGEPDHGVVTIAPGMVFPNFSPGDPPFLCNARKSPATLITYRSTPGFSGQDTASVQVFFPDGNAPTMLFHVSVQ